MKDDEDLIRDMISAKGGIELLQGLIKKTFPPCVSDCLIKVFNGDTDDSDVLQDINDAALDAYNNEDIDKKMLTAILDASNKAAEKRKKKKTKGE